MNLRWPSSGSKSCAPVAKGQEHGVSAIVSEAADIDGVGAVATLQFDVR